MRTKWLNLNLNDISFREMTNIFFTEVRQDFEIEFTTMIK